LTVPEILQILSLTKQTGKLTLSRMGNCGEIGFKNGDVIYASSDSRRTTLGEVLINQKRITENALMAALEQYYLSTHNKRLGTILVENGIITPAVLQEAIQHQIEQVISEFLTWQTGFFKFETMEISTDEDILVDANDFLVKAGISAEQLLIKGIPRVEERREDEKREQPRHDVTPSPAPPVAETPKPWIRAARDEQPVPAVPPPSHAIPEAQIQEKQSSSIADEIMFESPIGPLVLFMAFAPGIVRRGVLFIVRNDGITVHEQFGVDIGLASGNEQVHKIKIPLSESSIFTEVLSRRKAYQGKIAPGKWNDYFLAQLGDSRPHEAVVIPIIVAENVAAIFYGDNAETGKPLGDAGENLELLIEQTFSGPETSVLEKKTKPPV
jgi:hypothetical protein